MRIILSIVVSIFLTGVGHTAACCGGGASFPSLILSDDKAQLGVSASFSKVIGDAPSDGKPVFRSSKDDEWTHTYTLDAATLMTDRWQVGTAVPLVYRSRSNPAADVSEWGLGDISATLGYEVLPEYTYSAWKPRAFLFLQATVPTGGNTYESEKTFEVDARGKGFYSFSLGSFLIKTFGSWDTSLRLSYLYSLPQTFKTSSGASLKISPGQVYNMAAALGYSPMQSDWRFGLSINPTYTTLNNSSDYRLVWTSAAEITRLFNRRWVLGVSYSDQTLLGPAKNSSLERALVLFCRLKWER